MKLPGWVQAAVGRRIMDRFGKAGGGLLAGGLTYAALFALLPTLLLLASILGFVVDDAERREAIVESIAEGLPPLREFLAASLEDLSRGAAGAGTVGLIGLAWGASRFYGSLDDAFSRVFDTAPQRGFVARTVRGFLSVVLLITVFLLALILTGIASFLAEETATRLGSDARTIWGVATPLLTLLVFVGGMAIIYRLVPSRHVPWRTLLLPATVVGALLTVLTQFFSFVAPRLIGAAAVYGTFVAIFAAMVWLSFGVQLILIGACWLRERLGAMPPPFLDD
jgi:membrane protein